MNYFMLSYDLNASGQICNELIAEIKVSRHSTGSRCYCRSLGNRAWRTAPHHRLALGKMCRFPSHAPSLEAATQRGGIALNRDYYERIYGF
jgi:hypothetical protein